MAGLGAVVAAGTEVAGASTWTTHVSLAGSRAADPVSSQDRMFMDQASQINQAEISLGRYMQAHATTTAAKTLGAAYARDHAAAQARLQELALRLHVSLPATAGAHLQTVITRVEAQKGKNRDIAFATASITGHRTAIAVFGKEGSSGGNPAVRAYAARYLPMLRKHLRLAEHAVSVIQVTPAR
jgi:putative membrane protein